MGSANELEVSARGFIALETKPGSFSGRFHGHSTKPSKLGCILYHTLRGAYQSNASQFLSFLSAHIQSEMHHIVCEETAYYFGCEWGYIFLPSGDMQVAKTYVPRAQRARLVYGSTRPWYVLRQIKLQDREPHWLTLDGY